MERDLWAVSGIVQGAVVADGCGPAAVSVVIAGIVGPSGRVVAVDRDAGTVETARAVAARADDAKNVSVAVGEADDTGIAPGSVDVVMIRHVLAHNQADEEAIVTHDATLVRPGGSVYLTEGYPRPCIPRIPTWRTSPLLRRLAPPARQRPRRRVAPRRTARGCGTKGCRTSRAIQHLHAPARLPASELGGSRSLVPQGWQQKMTWSGGGRLGTARQRRRPTHGLRASLPSRRPPPRLLSPPPRVL